MNSQDSIEELKKELEETKKQRDEYLAGWQRARADFLNYKKEEMERFQGVIEYANEAFLLKLLPIIDSFEIAERAVGERKTDPTLQGILQIGQQLRDFIKNCGVEEIKTEGEKFNPALHEAVGEIEIEGKSSGEIGEVIEKGYLFGGRLLRPAKVKVVK